MEQDDKKKGSGISREVTCKECNFEGVVEAHDTVGYPEKSIFKLLGKDPEGYIHLKCPNCEKDISYSPFDFMRSKGGSGCLATILILIVPLLALYLY